MSNQYTYKVPFTEEQLFNDYCNKMMTQVEIARKYGTTQKVIWKAMQKMGIPTRKAYKRHQEGPANSSWKGGKVLKKANADKNVRFLSSRSKENAYWMIRRPDHSHAHHNGYVFEHLVVALESAGMEKLPKNHCVHHIDFNKQNNDPSNLQICHHDKHREYHGKLESLVGELLDLGIVKFDKEKGYIRCL